MVSPPTWKVSWELHGPLMASKYLQYLSFDLWILVTRSTHFFDSSCNFFVSYTHGSLLVGEDLQQVFERNMPSRAPETASLSRCRQHPWCARPVDRGLGSVVGVVRLKVRTTLNFCLSVWGAWQKWKYQYRRCTLHHPGVFRQTLTRTAAF